MEEKARAYMQRHPGASPQQVLVWLRSADEATRRAGLELVRTPPKQTIGEALRSAKRECTSEWQIPNTVIQTVVQKEQRAALSPGPNAADSSSTETAIVPFTKKLQAPVTANGTPQKGAPLYCKRSKGRWLCEKWNLGKCSNPCPDENFHGCDVRLETGAACASTSHNRLGHR